MSQPEFESEYTSKVVSHVLVKWAAKASEYGIVPGSERLYTWDEYMEDKTLDTANEDAWELHKYLSEDEAEQYRSGQ